MPLVHQLFGTGFAGQKARGGESRGNRPAPQSTNESRSPGSVPGAFGACRLCASQAPIFDLSMRCCLDRYESQFGSVNQHRSMFAFAKAAALDGDFVPARRLVESYRRAFGPMAAVALRRFLWEAIAQAQIHPHPDVAARLPRQPGQTA